MAASKRDIVGWFDRGVEENATYMIVVCDTFDWEDYPVYVGKDEEFYSIHDKYTNGQNMQRVMEVYDLKADKNTQLDSRRVFNLPPRK